MKQKKSLVEIAKNSVSSTKERTQDEIDLALAWARNEISLQQVQVALNVKGMSTCYVFLSTSLRAYVQQSMPSIP